MVKNHSIEGSLLKRSIIPVSNRPLLHTEDQAIDYLPRPGAYAVIINSQKELLLIQEPTGWFLPGGGQDENETLDQTLIREIREELGVTAKAVSYLLAADDCRYSPIYKQQFHIQSHYFITEIPTDKSFVSEEQSEAVWVPLSQAATQITRYSDKWLCDLLLGDFQLVTREISIDNIRAENPGHIYWNNGLQSQWHEAEFILKKDQNTVAWIRLSLAPAEYEVRALFLSGISMARPLLGHLERVFKGITITDPGGLFSE